MTGITLTIKPFPPLLAKPHFSALSVCYVAFGVVAMACQSAWSYLIYRDVPMREWLLAGWAGEAGRWLWHGDPPAPSPPVL